MKKAAELRALIPVASVKQPTKDHPSMIAFSVRVGVGVATDELKTVEDTTVWVEEAAADGDLCIEIVEERRATMEFTCELLRDTMEDAAAEGELNALELWIELVEDVVETIEFSVLLCDILDDGSAEGELSTLD